MISDVFVISPCQGDSGDGGIHILSDDDPKEVFLLPFD